jgi:catalase
LATNYQQPTNETEDSYEKLTTAFGAPVNDNQNKNRWQAGPALLENVWFIEKMAHFDREVIPERRMHAKGAGALGAFTVTHDITKYTRAKIFSEIGNVTPMFARFSTVAGERGAADAERDIRGHCVEVLHRGRQLEPRRQQHACFLHPRSAQVP